MSRHEAMQPSIWVGLAWRMAPLQPGLALIKIAKNGGTAGFHSHITFVKETQAGVVMLANTAVRSVLDRAAVRIMRVLNQGSDRDTAIKEPIDEPSDGTEDFWG
jgi:CubicO group peptidase (beta-lactamase class C family)